MISRSAGVKDVTGHQQSINFILLNRLRYPTQKSFEFLVAFSAVKVASDVPVGCVESSHTANQPPQRRGAARILYASLLMKSYLPEVHLDLVDSLVIPLAASAQTWSIWS